MGYWCSKHLWGQKKQNEVLRFHLHQVSGFLKIGPCVNGLVIEMLHVIGNLQSGQSLLWPSGMEESVLRTSSEITGVHM